MHNGNPRPANTLAAAHGAVAAVAAAGVVFLVVAQGGLAPRIAEDWLRTRIPIQATFGCVLGWLAATAAAELWRALQWRRGTAGGNSTWRIMLLEQAALVAVLVFVLIRGANSRVLLYGLSDVAATVSVVATTGLLVGLADGRFATGAATQDESRLTPWPWAIQAVLTAALAAALLGLEWPTLVRPAG